MQQRLIARHAFAAEVIGVVDHQDGVLTNQTCEQDHADHAHDVERVAGHGEQTEGTNQREGQAQHDDEWKQHAFEQ